MTRGRVLGRAVVLVPLTVMALASASCADPGEVIAQSAARQMRVQLDDVRAAVDAADLRTARQALRGLERDTVRLRDEGLIDPVRADSILAAAREVAVQLSLLPDASVVPSPTVSPSFDPGSSEDEEGDDEGEEHGNGKGKGKDKGKGHGHDE